MCVYVHVYVNVCVCTCMFMYMYMCVNVVYMCVCLYTCTCICKCMCMYVYVCVCVLALGRRIFYSCFGFVLIILKFVLFVHGLHGNYLRIHLIIIHLQCTCMLHVLNVYLSLTHSSFGQ